MPKRRSTKKKGARNKKRGGMNFSLLFAIAVGLFALIYYGLRDASRLSAGETANPSFSDFSNKNTTPPPSTTRLKHTPDRYTAKTDSRGTTSNPRRRKKFDREQIDALDGAAESDLPNTQLPNYAQDDDYYFTSSFDFAWPAYSKNDEIVEHTYYTLKYDEKTEQADWVAYRLEGALLRRPKFKRKNDFRSDPDVRTQSATLADYKGSGFDRGHLAPATDFAWTKEGMSESFFMSNMSPQHPSFNRGIWKRLEEKIRQWAKSNQELYVVTGPIYEGPRRKIGTNKVVVPAKYYKVILDIHGPEIKGIGFIMKNKKSSDPLSIYAVSIDEVEKKTKLDFFPSLPDDLEQKIESTYAFELWE